MRTRPTPPPPAATPPDAGPARQNGGETTAAAARAHHEQLAVTPREGALFVQTIFPPTPAANDGPDPASSRHMPYGRDYRPRGYSVDATSSHVHQRRAQFTLSAAGAHNSGEADVGDDYACELCDVVCNDPFELELHERSHDDESAAARHRDRRAAGPAGRGGFSDTAAAGSEYHAMEIEEEEEEGGDGDGDGDGDDDPSRSKPHGCPVCPRRFRYRGEVAVHARTHTGEKPFTCPHVNCTMRFKSRPELQKHGKVGSDFPSCPFPSMRPMSILRRRTTSPPHPPPLILLCLPLLSFLLVLLAWDLIYGQIAYPATLNSATDRYPPYPPSSPRLS